MHTQLSSLDALVTFRHTPSQNILSPHPSPSLYDSHLCALPSSPLSFSQQSLPSHLYTRDNRYIIHPLSLFSACYLWRQQRHMEDISSNLGLPPWSDNPHPGPAPAPAPQTLWQAYQLAEQWCWDRWKELEGAPPPPPPPPPTPQHRP